MSSCVLLAWFLPGCWLIAAAAYYLLCITLIERSIMLIVWPVACIWPLNMHADAGCSVAGWLKKTVSGSRRASKAKAKGRTKS